MSEDTDYTQKLNELNEKIALQPDNIQFYKERAFLNRCRYPDDAINDFTKLIELVPNDAYFYYMQRAICFLNLYWIKYNKEFEPNNNLILAAIDDYSQVIQLKGNYRNAYLERGNIYYRIKNYTEALKDFKKMIEHGYVQHFDDGELYVKIARCYKEMKKYDDILDSLKKAEFYHSIGVDEEDMDAIFDGIIEQKNYAVIQARIDERNKIIADLSHSIKNLISTVIDPLESMKKEHAEENQVIENALKGANLIREIVNAMNLSFKGSIDDFYYDAKHNTGKDALFMGDIVTQSLIYSIGHMFDAKYFANFLHKYFPERSIFQEAKAVWQEKSQVKNIEELLPFIRQYFFDMQLNIADTADLRMGNEKGSAIKLLILLQEMIFNSVKYSAFVEKDRRFLHIDLKSDENQIVITVENRYKKTVKTKTSGLGLVIIKNFAKLLENKPDIRQDEDIYSVTIRFADFWKEKSE